MQCWNFCFLDWFHELHQLPPRKSGRFFCGDGFFKLLYLLAQPVLSSRGSALPNVRKWFNDTFEWSF